MADAKTETTLDQYAVWQSVLDGGEKPKLAPDEVYPGFYRNRGRAYAFWLDKNGALRCRVNGQDITESRARYDFAYCWKAGPIKKEWYDQFIKDGTWPDQSEAVTATMGKNAPDEDTEEGVMAMIESLAFEAERLMKKGAAATQEEADVATDISVRLGRLFKAGDNMRKVQQQPLDEQIEEIRQRWRPSLALAGIYKDMKAAIVDPFLRKRQAEIDAENKRIRDENAAAQKKVDDERRKAEEEAFARGDDPDEVVLPVAAPKRELIENASAGTRGKKITQRKVVSAKITDWDKLWAVLKTRDDVKEFIQAIADKAAKGGNPLDGTETFNDTKAV